MTTRLLLSALAAAAGLALPATAAAKPPKVAETPVTAPGGALARDAAGRVWVAEPGAGRLERVGGPSAVLGAAPAGVATGPDGALWYVDADGRLARLEADGSSTVVATIEGDPTDVVLGPDGALWVTAVAGGGAGPSVVRVTRLGQRTRYLLPAGTVPRTAVAGGDGGVWFVDAGASTAIFRVDAATGTGLRYLLGGAAPAGLAWREDGVWFTRPQGAVGRMTPQGRVTAFTDGLGGAALTAIAPGPDGAMWFTGADQLGRVDADGDVDVHRGVVRPPATGADLLADGPDLWLSFSDRSTVARIAVPPVVQASAEAIGDTAIRVVGPVPAGWQDAVFTVEIRRPGGGWSTATTLGTPTGQVVSGVVDGLAPDTLQQLRLVGTGDGGETRSRVLTVRTPPTPAAPPQAPPVPAGDPAPVATPAPPAPPPPAADTPAPEAEVGRTLVVKPDRGTVKVKVPGKGFAALGDMAEIPVDAVVDATAGSVALTSELADGTTQVGHFSGGRFRVQQSKARGGLTRILLAGKLDCGRSPHALATAARKKRKRRQVWGRDDGGSFQTNGRESVATVRGTRWLTRDTCKGTLVKVVEGAVDVRDKDTGRTVRVRAGRSRFTR